MTSFGRQDGAGPARVVLVVAGVDAGGCERRFANLFKHLATLPAERLPWDATFLVDAAMQARVTAFQAVPRSDRVRLLPFGVAAGRGRLPKGVKTAVRWANLAAGSAVLAGQLRRRQDALVHFVNPMAMRLGPLVRGRPLVVSFVAAGHPERKLGLPAFRALLRRGASVDCLSADLARHVSAERGIAGVATHVSPGSFVDTSRYGEPRLRRPLVTFAGRLNEIKGVRLLAAVLPDILALDPQIRVRVLGRGPLEAELRARIAGLSEPDRVEVTYATDIAPHLMESMVFLSLQQQENYPSQSLLEAMLAGNAVVATDVGLTHLLVDDSVGFRVRGAGELVTAVGTLMRDPGLRERCGAAARRRVLEEHSVDRFVTYLEGVYAATAPAGAL